MSRQTFDNFVIGDGNRAAHMAAYEVAKDPGRRYNPLFLYGGTGTGKSHLLEAIARESVRFDPSLRVHYTNYPTLEELILESRGAETGNRLRPILSKVDIFLIDDIRNDHSWLTVQREMIDWLDRFIEEERQIVLSSDKSPLDLDPSEERFLSRIQRGLVVSLEQIDLPVKRELIARWIEAEGIESSDEALDLIANLPVVDARELSGIVNRLLVSLSSEKAALTGEWLTATLRQLIRTGEIRKFRVTPPVQKTDKKIRKEWFETASPEETELLENEVLSIAEMDVQWRKEPFDEDEPDDGEDHGVDTAEADDGEAGESKAIAQKDRRSREIDESEGFIMEWDREIDRLLDEL